MKAYENSLKNVVQLNPDTCDWYVKEEWIKFYVQEMSRLETGCFAAGL
jgi:hypothetical protein